MSRQNLPRGDDYQHFSRVVSPLLVGFTLPTIAVIVTTPAGDWNQYRYPILCLFLASNGLLLASVQLSVGQLFKDVSPWNEIRAALCASGLICLAIGLALLAASQIKADRTALILTLVIFGAGVLIPIGLNFWYWIRPQGNKETDSTTAAELLDLNPAEHVVMTDRFE